MSELELARAAKRLLEDEAVAEALDRLQHKMFLEWQHEDCTEEDRDTLWHRSQALSAVVNELRIMADEEAFRGRNVT